MIGHRDLADPRWSPARGSTTGPREPATTSVAQHVVSAAKDHGDLRGRRARKRPGRRGVTVLMDRRSLPEARLRVIVSRLGPPPHRARGGLAVGGRMGVLQAVKGRGLCGRELVFPWAAGERRRMPDDCWQSRSSGWPSHLPRTGGRSTTAALFRLLWYCQRACKCPGLLRRFRRPRRGGKQVLHRHHAVLMLKQALNDRGQGGDRLGAVSAAVVKQYHRSIAHIGQHALDN
jgi:hypothetical protein